MPCGLDDAAGPAGGDDRLPTFSVASARTKVARDDILDLSKIEAGKVDVSVETVGIEGLLGQLEHRFEPLTRDKGLELFIAAEPGCPETLQTDHQRLQQIPTNLLANAIKFTHRRSVRLSAARSGATHVAFTVEDTGIGIPAEQHEVIFGAFRQADGTTSREYGGTGLGLSICRELVELLGGQIELRSAPDRGSAFDVLVPVRYEGTPATALSTATPAFRAPLHQEPAVIQATPPASAGPAVSDDRDALINSHLKGARSPERLLEEVTLFLHQVESDLSPEKQHMLERARTREPVFEGRRILLVEDDVRSVFALTSWPLASSKDTRAEQSTTCSNRSMNTCYAARQTCSSRWQGRRCNCAKQSGCARCTLPYSGMTFAIR